MTAVTIPTPSAGPRRVLHIVHGWPPYAMGGTEQYAAWLVQQQRAVPGRALMVHARQADATRPQGAILEMDDGGVPVRLYNNRLEQRNPLARNSVHDPAIQREMRGVLRQFRPDLVHVHHLLGHGFALNGLLRRSGVALVQQVQDWWALCVHANYTHRTCVRCQGPSLNRCHDCAVLTRLRPQPLSNRLLHGLRRLAARRALAHADACIMGSTAVHADYVAAGLFAPRTRVHVLPYGVAQPEAKPARAPTRLPLRCGFIGAPTPHKGLQIARAAFEGVDPALATLQVWGYAGTRFAEADKDAVYAGMDVLLFPSVGLESYGLAAYEAIARGVPVIATDDGALRDLPATRFFPNGDAAALRTHILELAHNPAQVDQWSRSLPPVRSTDTHAAAVEAVYAEVMGRWGYASAQGG